MRDVTLQKGDVTISTLNGPLVKKSLVEAVVIVASILLAFGIDAAWDLRQERRAEDQHLRALIIEMDGNAAELEHRRKQGAEARSAQRELIDVIGPEPGALSSDSLSALLRTSMSFGIVEVESAALDAAIIGIDPSTPSQIDLLRLLRIYRTELEDHRLEDRNQFIHDRAEIFRYLITVSPFAFVWAGNSTHSSTDFEVPVASLLRDQRLEGLISQISVRTLQMTRTIDTLETLSESITTLATAELGED